MERRVRLPFGLYEKLLTRTETGSISDTAIIETVDGQRAPHALANLVRDRLLGVLKDIHGEASEAERVRVVNDVLALVGVDDRLEPPPRELRAVLEPVESPATPEEPIRPRIALSSSDLLVNGPHDLKIGAELQRELASADRVDLLCAFVKWSGFQRIEQQIEDLARRRGASSIRVLTTVYMGATERRALDALAALGAQVRVSYDTMQTRLHAKAWLIHRASGYSTAYIGSSNLSAAAMHDGVEWNVRLSAIDNPAILEKFTSTFEQYWADTTFRPYDVREFDAAVLSSRRRDLAPYLIVDVEPRAHQREILEEIAAERSAGHNRNLVVAATGTGKTIVAALDYKRLRARLPRARLLFVAHRREILDQSLKAFQVVLRDGSFGELLASGQRPDRWEHVFASIQSLHKSQLSQLKPDYFDVVIIDEFHHAASETYETLLTHLNPRVLLGLTATPERADGQSILKWFDGRIASELRLWKALDQGLLAPFQYFGVGGAPDVTAVSWSRGRYDLTQLSNVYTADHIFAKRVVQETVKKVSDPGKMRALGFCVDIAHATFMSKVFNDAGIPSAAVSADTPDKSRAGHLAALRQGQLRCIFSVDLFNEGVDVPDVDTVLFLRPTESATVFLQQLGRGLRRSDGKECLTVLDFIGDANRRFRFDLRYRAIAGGTRRSIEREIEDGFPTLPSGCTIQLDKQAQGAVLDNIRGQLGAGSKALLEDLRGLGPATTLPQFLVAAGIELEDLYANGRTFTGLRRDAGYETRSPGPYDEQMQRALSRMLHLDDPARLQGIRELVRGPLPKPNDGDPIQRWLHTLLGYIQQPYAQMASAWAAVWKNDALREEIDQLLGAVADRVRRNTIPLRGPLATFPLRVHATYTLDEILAGVDERNSKGALKRIQTGVHYIEKHRCDLLFVTLEKSEKEYSPTTLYNDYAISPTRFHWETQSGCHPDSPTGRRYIDSKVGRDHVLLFVRQRRRDARGETMPYLFLGQARYAAHRGARPMQIEWELQDAMPASFYQETKVAAG